MSAYTKGPWTLGEYDEHLGYDCTTGGVRAGPVHLDGNSYGQRACESISPEQLDRLMADARLIAAAPDLLASCESLVRMYDEGASLVGLVSQVLGEARAAIAKATGGQP